LVTLLLNLLMRFNRIRCLLCDLVLTILHYHTGGRFFTGYDSGQENLDFPLICS
jgi:hypothetical protein